MIGWLDIATLVEMKDFKGSFVATAAPGLPFLLSEGMKVSLVPPILDAPRNVVVSSVSGIIEHSAKVRFAQVSDPSLAEKLIGCHILARAETVSAKAFANDSTLAEGILADCGISTAYNLLGWTVFNEQGRTIGRVVRVEDNPANPILILEDSNGVEAMVPLVADFVCEVEKSTRSLIMRLPKGLIDSLTPRH